MPKTKSGKWSVRLAAGLVGILKSKEQSWQVWAACAIGALFFLLLLGELFIFE